MATPTTSYGIADSTNRSREAGRLDGVRLTDQSQHKGGSISRSTLRRARRVSALSAPIFWDASATRALLMLAVTRHSVYPAVSARLYYAFASALARSSTSSGRRSVVRSHSIAAARSAAAKRLSPTSAGGDRNDVGSGARASERTTSALTMSRTTPPGNAATVALPRG